MVLRAPRIVSDDAPILRFAAARDLQSIQALIGRGLASPADVGHSYGLTALHVRSVMAKNPVGCQIADDVSATDCLCQQGHPDVPVPRAARSRCLLRDILTTVSSRIWIIHLSERDGPAVTSLSSSGC
jgi:hypothetical protein